MQISITDSATFDIYKRYLNLLVIGEEPTKDNPFIFEVDEMGKGTPRERLQQAFAYEAIQDGNTTLSLAEAKEIDQYYKSTNPTLRALYRFDLPGVPTDDPDLETAIGLTSLGLIEWYANLLPGRGAKKDLFAALAAHPKLAIFLHPSYPENLLWLLEAFEVLRDNPPFRQLLLERLGRLADTQSIYEPIEYCLEKSRSGMLASVEREIFYVAYQEAMDDPDFQQAMNNRQAVLALADSPNMFIAGEALVQNAKMHLDKSVILRVMAGTQDYKVYNKALEALAIWGDQECITVLTDIVRYGGFQQYIMAQAAMRNHLPIDRLADISMSFLRDDDPFVRSAGLKLVQFLWHKEGFTRYRSTFLGEVKLIAASDPNKFVRMSAIECIGYSHDAELVDWLDTLSEGPDFDPFIKAAHSHFSKKEFPSGFDNIIDFMSDTYAFPIQYKWITKTLKKMARQGHKQLKVLFTGGSFGSEAVGLIMEVMKDYEADPAAWNGFNPVQDLKIIVSDIEPQVLLYAERGRYYAGKAREEIGNEYFGTMLYHKVYEEDFFGVLTRFFNPVSGNDQCTTQYKMKERYARMLEFRYLDVTERPNEPIADIVTFNRLDYIWQYDPNTTIWVVEQVFALSSNYVAYASWNNMWTVIPLSRYGNTVYKSGPLGFMRKKDR